MRWCLTIIFVLAAVLTSSGDAWNQAVYSAPMIVLYLISIGVAWMAGPKRHTEKASPLDSSHKLRLVIAATVIDQARKRRRRSSTELPARWRGVV